MFQIAEFDNGMIFSLPFGLRVVESAVIKYNIEIGKRPVFPGETDIVVGLVVFGILLVKPNQLHAGIKCDPAGQAVQIHIFADGRCTNLLKLIAVVLNIQVEVRGGS